MENYKIKRSIDGEERLIELTLGEVEEIFRLVEDNYNLEDCRDAILNKYSTDVLSVIIDDTLHYYKKFRDNDDTWITDMDDAIERAEHLALESMGYNPDDDLQIAILEVKLIELIEKYGSPSLTVSIANRESSKDIYDIEVTDTSKENSEVVYFTQFVEADLPNVITMCSKLEIKLAFTYEPLTEEEVAEKVWNTPVIDLLQASKK